MKRREFFKMLAGLPFLGFLKGKEEPKGLTLPQLMEAKKQIDDNVPTSSTFSTSSNDTGYCYYDGKFIYSGNYRSLCHLDDGLYCSRDTTEGCEYMWTMHLVSSLDEEDGQY